jgi:hypothetical protein
MDQMTEVKNLTIGLPQTTLDLKASRSCQNLWTDIENIGASSSLAPFT